jgi:hypothetical protein
VDALEKIVAQKCVLGHATFQAPGEGVNIVNAFAHINALAEKVLVDIRDGMSVEVYAGRVAEDT